MRNPYETLGVNRDSSPDQIKRAYRKLASQHHPDKGGDKGKFQEIEAAYRTLSDPQQRSQFDNPDPFGPGGFSFRGDAPFDFESIFNIFGTRFQHPGQQQQRRQQARMSLWIQLRDVAEGGKKTISVGTNAGTHAVEIEIPLGINDGDTVQYPGIGPGGIDLIVQYRIHPDPRFERRDLNLYMDHTVNIWNLIAGGETVIRDILGNTLSLSVNPRTQPGTIVRLRGRGLASRSGGAGDLMVCLQARIPDVIGPELLELIQQENPK
jgi:DnaJ-class molecular chaperone